MGSQTTDFRTYQEHGSTGAEERLHLALVAGRMGIWELDLGRKKTLRFSPELQKLLAFEAEFDGQVRTFLDRVHPSDRVSVLRKMISAIREARNLELEFRFTRPGRPPLWLLSRGRPYRGAGRVPQRLIGVVIDITAQKVAEQEVERLNAELGHQITLRMAQLDAVNKELEAFCYSVSHDLRAPLRSIRGFNEVLLQRYGHQLDARGQEFLRRACESSHYMDELIEKLLKLSRVGRSEISNSNVNLSARANEIADELQRSDPLRKVSFVIAKGLNAYGDKHMLGIMLQHLIGNAWKFTSKLEQARIQFGYSEAESAFFVRDNGTGFDPAYTGRLFGAFQRLHSISEFPGTGVGLATVLRIVNRHGGRVWAEGAVDKGATFYFCLPRNEAI
jgi:signal transduction histidine kinase